MPPAQPLNTPSKTQGDSDSTAARDKTPTPGSAVKKQAGVNGLGSQISSPHELTAFVETLLEQLELKFDDTSAQILDRMAQMSSRVDALEAAIQDIINGDISTPGFTSTPPSPLAATPGVRRSESTSGG